MSPALDRAEVTVLEQIANDLARFRPDHDSIGISECLQPRRQVWRVADDAALLRLAGADQVADDDQPSGNADASLQRDRSLQRADRRDQLQPRSHGSLGVVLVGLGVAEVNQYAVTHILGNETSKAPHGLCNALLVGRNDLAEVFRVHARR